jgi:hypothetical protein
MPSTAQPLPFELKPGAEWTGIALQNAQVEEWAIEGELYIVPYHSHSEKPLRKRVSLSTLNGIVPSTLFGMFGLPHCRV